METTNHHCHQKVGHHEHRVLQFHTKSHDKDSIITFKPNSQNAVSNSKSHKKIKIELKVSRFFKTLNSFRKIDTTTSDMIIQISQICMK